MRLGRPHDLVAQVGPGIVDRLDLRVLGEPVVHLPIAFDDLGHEPVVVDERPTRTGVHPRNELLGGFGYDEVRAVAFERLDRCRRIARAHPIERDPQVLLRDVRVLLRTREGELLADDRLVEHEPRVVVPALEDRAHRPVGVEAGIVRCRKPSALRIEPHRRRARNDPDAVIRPDRIPVLDAFRVRPDPVPIDQARPGVLGDGEHPPVHMGGNPGEHRVRELAEALDRPIPAHEVEVVPDPAAGDDHSRSAELEILALLPVRGHPAGGVAR